jgi:oxygen-independent coproporphyrinogen-3 oxidase
MGLRLAEGVDLAALSYRFGLSRDAMFDPGKLAFYAAQELLWNDRDRIGVTPAGMPLLDALLGELVPEALLAA